MTRSLPRAALAPLAIKPLAGILVGLFALVMVTANGYGFHRDELYFIEAGHHPARAFLHGGGPPPAGGLCRPAAADAADRSRRDGRVRQHTGWPAGAVGAGDG